MEIKLKLLIAVITLCLVQTAYAVRQQPFHTFHRIDSRDGLPDNSVNAIVQDQRGYIWFATWNGLSLYDGTTHHVFVSDQKSETALGDNMVRALCPDGNGMWVGTDSGLEFLDFDNCQFSHCTLNLAEGGSERSVIRINDIIKVAGHIIANDNHGRLLRSTSERCVLDVVNLGNEKVVAICPYDNRQFIAVTHRSIRFVDANNMKTYTKYGIEQNFSVENANVYYSNNTGLIYIGDGMGKPGTALQIDSDGDISPSTAFVPDNLTGVIDVDNYIYFATDGDGLWRIDPQGTILNFNETNSNYRGSAIYSLAADSNNNLWIGSYRCGLWMFSPQFNMFDIYNKENGKLNFDIVSAIATSGDKLFIGLDGGGLEIIDSDINVPHRVLTSQNSALSGNNVVCTVVDGQKLWLGLYTEGLGCYDIANGTLDVYHIPSAESSNVWQLCDDGKGFIWTCGRSLFVFDKTTHRFEMVKEMKDKLCTSIVAHNNHIYVSTRTDGIYKIDRNQRKIVEHYCTDHPKGFAPSNNITCFSIDSQGDFWFALRDYGLAHWSVTDENLQIIGRQQGLPEQRINSITEDKMGAIWVGTDNGLYLLPNGSKRFTKINDAAIPATFVYNSSAQRGDTIYFGTTQGMLAFNILDVSLQQYKGKIYFQGVKILSEDDKYINLYSDHPSAISLDPNENYITVYFSVPDLLNQHAKCYSYRLQGLEDSWHETEDPHGATYTNLDPGHYNLQVRHLINNGQWSEASVLPLIVRPHWYDSTVAKVGWWLLILAITAAAVYVIIRTLRLKQRAKISEIERQAATALNNAKLDFYAQITHDLRTPAFLISAQLEGLLDNPDNVVQVRRSQISSILTNSKKLNKMVNRIIDLRKMDQGYLSLVCQRADVERFVSTLLPYYEGLCRQKDLEFGYVHDPAPIIMDFDADKLEMVLSNLISNAYKYTPEYGKVTLSLHDEGDKIIFSVLDTGIGIVKDAQTQIFDKYVRTERGRMQSSGDGLGLAYVKEIVALYGGAINVVSEPNNGSEFIVQLPKWQSDTATESEVIGDTSYMETLADVPSTEKAVNPVATHTLLIIDDDASIAEVIARAFSTHFKVYIAKNGQEGYEMAQKIQPECILTDIMMPKLDGLQMVKMIREDKNLKNIKIAVFTAKESEEDIMKGYKIGIDAWYVKPMSLKLLKIHILKLLSKSKPVPQDYQPLAPENIETNSSHTLSNEDEELLCKCRSIIDENLTNPDFTLGLLAEQMAMSHSTLYKKVKRITGLSLIDMVNDYKIWKAVTMFQQGDTSITKVSEACGFHDLKVFRDTFKRKMGMSPKKYIQDLK